MVALADRALYWVKAHGRNGWAFWRHRAERDPGLDANAFRQAPGTEPADVGLALFHSQGGAAAIAGDGRNVPQPS